MARFRKKPVEIDAVQWTGDNREEIETHAKGFRRLDFDSNAHKGLLIIETLEGDMVASIDDWIIKGVHGEVYPCKPNIFAETYEAV